MIKLVKMLAASAVACALIGCVTVGDDFSSDVSWVAIGKTSQGDVSRILRAPYAKGNSSGTKTWKYGYYKYSIFGQYYQKELKLYWGKDNTVERFSFESSFPKDTGTKKPKR